MFIHPVKFAQKVTYSKSVWQSTNFNSGTQSDNDCPLVAYILTYMYSSICGQIVEPPKEMKIDLRNWELEKSKVVSKDTKLLTEVLFFLIKCN